MPSFLGQRRLALHEKRAAGFKYASLDVFKLGKALAMGDGQHLGLRDQFLCQRSLSQSAVLNQNGWLAFQNLIEAAMTEKKAYHKVIHSQQSRGANYSPGDRIVVADDRVLHRVR